MVETYEEGNRNKEGKRGEREGREKVGVGSV
jgi:hypothetical protein